jgi:hypothetical protein
LQLTITPKPACSAEWQSGIGLSEAVEADAGTPVGAMVTAPATPAPPSTRPAAPVTLATAFHNVAFLIASLPWGSIQLQPVYPKMA